MNDTTNTTGLRERLSWLLRDAEATDDWETESDATFIPVSLAGFRDTLQQTIAALSPPALEGMPDPIAYTRDNGPGKVVGLEWNPCYPVHTLRGRIALYASPVAAQAVTDGWQPIETAPKDGLLVMLWIEHANAQHSAAPILEGWAAPVVGQWSDFNNGGWVWKGLCGTPTGWMPLPIAHPNAAPCDAQGAES